MPQNRISGGLEHSRPTAVHRLARGAAARARKRAGPRVAKGDGLQRDTFTMDRDAARDAARAYLERYPKAAYWSRVEHWRELSDGRIEFTMVRLPTAD